MSEVLSVLEIFIFLSWIFCYEEKRLDKKAMVNFKVYDVAELITNNYNKLLPNIFRSKSNKSMKLGQLIKYSLRNIFLEKSCRK